ISAPNLILQDISIPRHYVFYVLEELRKFTDVTVIMLTARSNPQDKVQGLNVGADDYLTKPFSLDELFARVNAVLRRSKAGTNEQQHESSSIYTGNMEVNIGSK